MTGHTLGTQRRVFGFERAEHRCEFGFRLTREFVGEGVTALRHHGLRGGGGWFQALQVGQCLVEPGQVRGRKLSL